jgi:hypothetical protein
MSIRWIYRDPYVVYKIPEVRWLIARTYVLRLVRNLCAVVLLTACVPFLIVQLIGFTAKQCVDIIIMPSQWLSGHYRASREATYDVMSSEEMRARMTGHRPGIVQGSLRASSNVSVKAEDHSL